jgi:glycerol-3-phosphate O-acyltransferase
MMIRPRILRGAAMAIALFCLAAPRLSLAQEHKQKSELHQHMEEMDKSFKQLKRTIRSEAQDKQSLELLNKIEQIAVTCKGMVPSKTKTEPADKQDKFVLAYRKEMAHLISDFCAMETALLDGDHAKAEELYKKIADDKENGHDKFMDDEDNSDKKGK